MRRSGFTLIEILIYTALIGVAGVFLNSTLISVLRLQGQQDASTEVNQQINFVLQNIQKSVRESSLIDMEGNVASSTLTLRMTDTALDPTLIYLSGTTVYIKKGTANPLALTTISVNADQLDFTKVSSYPGHDSVSVDISFSYNTDNPQKAFTKTINSAISRVSGATFDSDILPGADATYSVGSVANRWQNLNLSGDLTVAGASSFTGNVGIGTAIPAVRLEVTGNAVYSNGNEAQLRISGTTDSNKRLNLGFDTTSDFGWIQPTKFGTAYKNLILNPAGAYVGIGTTTPDALLTVNGTARVMSKAVTLPTSGAGLELYYAADTLADSPAANFISYDRSASTYKPMVFDASRFNFRTGNLGIGTTSPSQALSVTGTIYSTAGYRFPDGTTQTTAGGGGGSVQAPSRQVLTSGSGTYTTPAGVGFIRIRMVGGGGGGGSWISASGNNGVVGGDTSFNSVTAAGGGYGPAYANAATPGGVGGTGGAGTASFRSPGGPGGSGCAVGDGCMPIGGSSVMGGGARTATKAGPGIAALANSGGGGSAGNGGGYGGGGGGGGEYVEIIINSPGATYAYSIGAGGAGGAGTQAGGAGGSGVIIVDEYYTTAFVSSSAVSVPSRQIFTSGSGTYTRPANVGQIQIRMVGGGGGGGSGYSTGTAGSAGGNTSFNSVVVNGGSGGGAYRSSVGPTGGAGGTGGTGTASLRIAGGGGGSSPYSGSGTGNSSTGGNSYFGGGGSAGDTAASSAGATNSGGGGGSPSSIAVTAANAVASGGGGGAGEYAELIINNPGATYSYTVGAGGAGGTGNYLAGGAGGSGIIIVDEYYSTVMSTDVSSSGTNTFTGTSNTFSNGVTYASGATQTDASMCTLYATADPSSVGSVTFSGLSSSYRYKLESQLQLKTASPWMALIINADYGANYKDSANITWNGGNYLQSVGTYGHTLYYINTNNGTVDSDGNMTTTIAPTYGSDKISIHSEGSWWYNGASGIMLTSGTIYTASGTLTSITVVGSTGQYNAAANGLANISGHLRLFRCAL